MVKVLFSEKPWYILHGSEKPEKAFRGFVPDYPCDPAMNFNPVQQILFLIFQIIFSP
jgi:hypothetical protein